MKGLTKLMVLEPPQADGMYFMGTDPIPFGDKMEATLDADDRSMQCSLILKHNIENPKAPYPVAYYLARTNDSNIVFDETVMLQKLYNDCLNNMERNAGGVMMKNYQDAGLSNLLASYPYTALLPNWKIIKVPKAKRILKGWNKDISTKGTAIGLLADWIPYGMPYTWSEDILIDIERLGIENADIADALVSALILWKHQTTVIENRHEARVPITRVVHVMENGRLVARTIKLFGIPEHEGIDGNLKDIVNKTNISALR
jgi:hypothetical protein